MRYIRQRGYPGVGDKPMSCKPGVAGSIPGFSIKTLSVEPLGVPVINTQIINPPGPVLGTTHGKATKSFSEATMV